MSRDTERPSVRFEPLRPADPGRLIVALILGPILWLVALIVGALLFHYTWAIQLGLLVVIVSFVLALVVLALLREGRRRLERRYEERG